MNSDNTAMDWKLMEKKKRFIKLASQNKVKINVVVKLIKTLIIPAPKDMLVKSISVIEKIINSSKTKEIIRKGRGMYFFLFFIKMKK